MRSGYLGQGIIIASRESATSKHGKKVAEVLKLVAPEATLLFGVDYKDDIDDLHPFDIYTSSLSFYSDTYGKNQEKAKKLFYNDRFLICAVGNDSDEEQSDLSYNDYFYSIGACTLKDGEAKRVYYSSITDDIDFMSLTDLEISDGKFSGTSCAAPLFAGMCALIQCHYLMNTGSKMNNEELIGFVEDNCIDLDEKGHDDRTGHGLFILPIIKDEEERDMSDSVIKREVRYKYLRDIPAGEFHDVIKDLVDRGVIKGRGGMGELTVVDLSDDMVRMLVMLTRAKFGL